MPRRKHKNPRRGKKYKYEFSSSSSSDQSGLMDKRQCTNKTENNKVCFNTTSDNSSVTDQNFTMNNSIQGLRYTTPMTSSPNIGIQPYQNFLPYPPPPFTMQHAQHPDSVGIDTCTLLKEICERIGRVELKLNTLDKIESRLDTIDTKHKQMDSEISNCKDRIGYLEQSVQFLSDVKDEHTALKTKVDYLSNGIESTKTDNKIVRDKIESIETQSLQQNLLFFAIEEKFEKVLVHDEEKGGATGQKGKTVQPIDNEICVETILDFCEKKLAIKDAKTKIKLERAYRLGKPSAEATKPRPIVVKFCEMSDREYVRSVSSRLKDTNYGISPHYPKDVLEKRKKLIPKMLEERKNKNKAYLVGDKLYVNGNLWQG